jgi:hypothetical protein
MLNINSKKGMSMAFIVGVVITLVAFVLIAPLAAKFVGEDEKKAEMLCQTSINLRASSMISVGGSILKTELKSPILCKTIDYEIEGDKRKLMSQIAEKMARCWWMFNEGRYEEIVKSSDIHLLKGVFGLKGNDCFVCYAIFIDEDKIENGMITKNELKDFLIDTKHPKIDMSYLNYFQSYGGSGKVGILESEILPKHVYGIVFMSKNNVDVSLLEAVSDIFSSPDIGNIYEKTQRDVSVIILDDLDTAQKYCFKGDIAGE